MIIIFQLEKQFTCLGENTEKHITFTVPIEKEVTRIDKNGEEITKNTSYILQFIDSARFVASLLPIIFLKEFIKVNLNTETMITNLKISELNINIVTVFSNTQTLKIEYKRLCCNKNY